LELERQLHPDPVVEGAHPRSAEQAAHDGFGDAVATKHADACHYALADEQQQDGEGEADEAIELHRAVLQGENDGIQWFTFRALPRDDVGEGPSRTPSVFLAIA